MRERLHILCGLVTSTASLIAAQEIPQPTKAAAKKFVQRYDRALESGEIGQLDSLFTPLHERAHAARRDWLSTALRSAAWDVTSKIADFGTIDELGLALLETTFRPRVEKKKLDDDDAIVTNHYLVFRMSEDGPVGILDAEVDTTHLAKMPLTERADGKLGCRACNYVIRADQDWLVVPHKPEQVGCLESISFYSLQHGLSMDISVHIDRKGPDPRAALTRLLRGKTTPEQRVGEIHEWIPPMHRDETPRGMSGVCAKVDDPDDWTSALHVTAFGPVLYLFAVQGNGKALTEHRASIDEVLGSFMLRETDLGKVRNTLRPIARHTGGSLKGAIYSNPKVGVTFAGPTGWESKLRCGGHLFHVTYSCPTDEGKLSVRAMAPPPGKRRWTIRSATWSIDYAIHRYDLVVDDDSGWERNDAGEFVRELSTHRKSDGLVRTFRGVLDPEQQTLFVLDARATKQATPSVCQWFDGLSRN